MALQQICDDCSIPLGDGDNVYCADCYADSKDMVTQLRDELSSVREELIQLNKDFTEMDMLRESAESSLADLQKKVESSSDSDE